MFPHWFLEVSCEPCSDPVGSIFLAKQEIVGFHKVFEGFCSTVFCVSCGTVAHRGRHVAPLGDVGFPLGLQGIPYRSAHARLGGAAAYPFPQ